MFGSNFEKTKRTTERRSFKEVEQVRARKGKRNKHERGGSEQWELRGATKEYSEKVHTKAIENFPLGVPRWAL